MSVYGPTYGATYGASPGPSMRPQVICEVGLLSGATVPAPYLILDDPVRGLLGTGTLAPDTLSADVSQYINAFTCFRGCSSTGSGPLITYEAGNATVTLINQDGRFDPDNYQGPYTSPDPAGGWTVTTLTGGTAGTFRVSALDALQLNAGDWVQFTAQPGGYIITAIGAPSGGNADVSIAPAAPGVIGTGTAVKYATLVTPQVFIRLRAIWEGVSWPIWSGFVTDWNPQYSGPEHSYCVLTCQDGMAYLAQDGLRTALGSPAGAAELSGARVNRILDSAGWPSGPDFRDIDPGVSLLQGTLLDGPPLAELQLVADSELGAFYLSADGRATFRDRHAILTRPASVTSQGTFGKVQDGALPYTDRDLSTGSVRLFNTFPVSTADPSSVLQVVSDAGSVNRYGTRSYPRSDLLLMTDAEALQWASLLLYQDKDPEQWFDSLTIDPRILGLPMYDQILGRDIGHRITVNRRPPGMALVSRDSFVRGITHSYGPGANVWQTVWNLQSAARYSFMHLDDPALGVLGHGRLGF